MRGSLAKKAMPDEQEQERSRRGEGAVAAASHEWTAGVQIYTGYDLVNNEKLIRTEVIVLHMVWALLIRNELLTL